MLRRTKSFIHFYRVNKFWRSLKKVDQHIFASFLLNHHLGGVVDKSLGVNGVVNFLGTQTLDDVRDLQVLSKIWQKELEQQLTDEYALTETLNADEGEETDVELDGPPSDVVRKNFNVHFSLKDGLDPSKVLVISRDLNNDQALVLQDSSVDSGNYIPIPPQAIAGLLRGFADRIEKQQEELNQSSFNG